MKKLMLSICLLMGGAVLVNAQQQDTASVQTPTQNQTMHDQDRMQIQVSELPQSIRTSLESQDFAGWTISAAYKLDGSVSTDAPASTQGNPSTQTDTSSEVKAAYLVELKNGAETKTVKFDKDGNKIEAKKESGQK